MDNLTWALVGVHQHGDGKKVGVRINALGRSRGGFSTKIHVIGDVSEVAARASLTTGRTAEPPPRRPLSMVEPRPRKGRAVKG